MKISMERPPIWEEANALFKLEELDMGTVMTYGEVLYNPFKVLIPEDLYEHEKTHAKQQEWDDTVAGLWWKRYLADPEFRIEQEVEAYANQYKLICERIHGREQQFRALRDLAASLSGPMYGNIISTGEVMRRIKSKL